MAEQLSEALLSKKKDGQVGFVPYVTAGYPSPADTVPLLLALQEGGASAIELGVPFSDPLADGPTIQRASNEALKHNITVDDCFGFVKDARKAGLTVPIVLMGYYNPFAQYGDENVVKAAAEATVGGFIVVDLPPEEAGVFATACKKHGVGFIPLVAPTTTDKRLSIIAEYASGYVYCVSVTGITGSRSELPPDLGAFLNRVRSALDAKSENKVPLAVGFGLSSREHVQAVGKLADGAVMGSKIIKTIDTADTTEGRVKAVRDFVQGICK